jgi:hypothetical protein
MYGTRMICGLVGDFLAMRNMDCLSMSSLLSALISRATCAIITVSHKALEWGHLVLILPTEGHVR